MFDILDAADAVSRFVAGKTLTEFENDEQLRSAVLMKLFIIGEASTRVSEQIRERYTEIPWHEIRGFRNFIAHHYFRLRWSVVWNTAIVHVAQLAAQIQEILQNEYPGTAPEDA